MRIELNPAAQFDAANRAIECTADAIAKQVTALRRRTARYEDVAPDYVIERLMVVLFGKYQCA
jgi:hypothetical protein